MKRANFLKLTLGAFLAPLAAWWPKKKPNVAQARNAKMFINGVEIPLQGPPDFEFVPRYDGDRAVVVGEWDCEMGFHASFVEPIDEQTWARIIKPGT